MEFDCLQGFGDFADFASWAFVSLWIIRYIIELHLDTFHCIQLLRFGYPVSLLWLAMAHGVFLL